MKKALLTCLLVLSVVFVNASHIVGGEFEMTFKLRDANGHFAYNLNLILYFDVINGSPGAQDSIIYVRIFRKRDNAVMINRISLFLNQKSMVEYMQPACVENVNNVSTRRMVYTHGALVNNAWQEIPLTLDPTLFTDEQGYYIAWERCCRNYNILNIYSEENNDVNLTKYAGQTFYLEFPALLQNNQPFINSSPALFKPLSDFACPGELYFADFRGEDADGDSLVYSIVTPLNTTTKESIPPSGLPNPGPYPRVQWRGDAFLQFSEQHMMHGYKELSISPDGMLTVIPSLNGLFVFAVRVEEFRHGRKIGEVRRDYQIFVVDKCSAGVPPVVEAKQKNAPNFTRGLLQASFPNTVSDEERCVIIRVSDRDSEAFRDQLREDVKIRAIPIGFKQDISNILPSITTATLTQGSAAEFTICFPRCSYTQGVYTIGIIAEDNSCPLPRMDTIKIELNIESPPNHPPLFDVQRIERVVQEGTSTQTFLIGVSDLDQHAITLTPQTTFNFEAYGFTLETTKNIDGRVEATLSWDTRCDQIDFSNQTNFVFSLLAEDADECLLDNPVPMEFNLTIDLIDVHPPLIHYVPDPSMKIVELETSIYESISFNVKGIDLDVSDLLRLQGLVEGTTLQHLQATFPSKQGTPTLESTFTWTPDCAVIDLTQQSKYNFNFIVIDDQNRCGYYLADTLHVEVTVLPPQNQAPYFFASNFNGVLEKEFVIGESIVIPIHAYDDDLYPKDHLSLSLSPNSSPLPPGATFSNTTGLGEVSGTLNWNPTCDLFMHKADQPTYVILFQVDDQRCYTGEVATMELKLTLNDVNRSYASVKPVNIITPNGDGKNDVFSMLREEQGNLINLLPPDNCFEQFKSITIYNRWGKRIYHSTDRDFIWEPHDISSGIYFYTIQFSDKQFKGSLHVANEPR
jgi:hypothetical protein